ncbi:MAG: DUF4416 family protein [bacterium]
MGKIIAPIKVKPFAGLLLSDAALLEEGKKALESFFGPIDMQSQIIPFSHTSYYNPEMGEHIHRLWVSFRELSDPGNLPAWKIESNRLEETWAEKAEGRLLRHMNIDPGYVSDSKLVLASTKDFSHRIYMSSGIYAEVTLNYRRDKGWQFFDWTYPDYRERVALDFFTLARNHLLAARKWQAEEK